MTSIDWKSRAEQAEAAAERLKHWVDDLQSGMFVNCVYCGHRYGPGETTPVSMADALKALDDALVRNHVIIDDSFIYRETIEWGGSDLHGCKQICVYIEELIN